MKGNVVGDYGISNLMTLPQNSWEYGRLSPIFKERIASDISPSSTLRRFLRKEGIINRVPLLSLLLSIWLGTSLTGVGGHLVSGFFSFFFFVGFCLLKGKRPKKFFYYHFDLSSTCRCDLYTVCLNSVVPYWNPAE